MRKYIRPAIIIAAMLLISIILFLLPRRGRQEGLIRSVTAIRLENSNPNETIKVTGIVTPWKEENISFEVGGRIQWVTARNVYVSSGSDPYSLTRNGDGALLAQIDPEEYELKLKTAQAQAAAAKANVAAREIEIREVKKRQLDAAKADVINAAREYNRQLKLKNKQVVSEQVFEKAETNYKIILAKYRELEATVNVKIAALKAEKAKFEQLQQTVKDAELNLKHTRLQAPFPGTIAEVFADVGAYVKAGEKVVRLIAMDPLIVKLDISPQLDRKFFYCQFVQVYPPGTDKPVAAIINRKASVADQRTFTYSLELLVRNDIINATPNLPKSITRLPRIKAVSPIGALRHEDGETPVVISEYIYKDKEGNFLWLAEQTPASIPGAPVFRVTKHYIKVKPGERDMLGLFKYRFITSKSPKVRHYALAAVGVPENFKSGSTAALIRTRRMFRPGDLVKVLLQSSDIPAGMYIPQAALCSDTRSYWVYKIMRRDDGSMYAGKVSVKIDGYFNDRILIRSSKLQPGDEIINEGAHFVSDGENIQVKSIGQVKL
ncbi:HlyD family efflux transporter periplasmic adaptor subunit [Lentisphaerota bacterium ZTH]|nr:HlyD family efflux transporter periplasmic adaptor subunit [Lentisphaerota bacterium]WET06880.1 HlyD family efflux transporter periplasmic adaptor subunit [Lentisphaerota bacterium ZTH]